MSSSASDFKSLSLKARGLKRVRELKSSGGDDDEAAPMEPETKKKAPTPRTTNSSGYHGQDTFKGYLLQDLPKDAWPQPGEHKGAHSYTLKGSNGAAP